MAKSVLAHGIMGRRGIVEVAAWISHICAVVQCMCSNFLSANNGLGYGVRCGVISPHLWPGVLAVGVVVR